LKFVLNIDSKQEAKPAHTELINSAEVLSKAINAPFPQQAKETIWAGRDRRWKIGDVNVTITRINWPTGNGYEVQLVVE